MAALHGTIQLLKISDDPGSDKPPTTTVTLRDIDNEDGSGDDDDNGASASPTSETESQPGLLQLPPELFDEVLNYLDPASTVLLALASKRLAWRFLLAHPPTPPPCLLRTAAAPRSAATSPSPEWSPWRALDDYVRAADDLAAAASRGGGRGVDGEGSPHRGHRARLLRTLDRDLPDLAYCHRCRRLHDPLLSFADPLYASPHKPRACCVYSTVDEDSAYLSSSTFSSSSASRSSTPDKRATTQHTYQHRRRRRRREPNRHDLPWRASRRALRCVAKRAVRGDGSHAPLLRQVNGTRTSCRGGALAQVSVRARCHRDGEGSGTRVLLRRRQVVASVDKTPLALWLFGARLEGAADGRAGGGGSGGGGSYHHTSGGSSSSSGSAGAGLPRIHWICAHLAWIDRYAVFVDRLLRPLCARVRAGLDHPVHGRACFDGRKPFDPAAQEGHAVAERLRQLRNATPAKAVLADGSAAPLGAVRSCDRCATDFCLDVAPLPAPFGWGFVLTTWMDPGVAMAGPAPPSSDASCRINDDDEPRPDDDRPDDGCRPDVYERFEGLRGPGPATSDIPPRDLERIRNYGWAERAAAGGPERYVAWESAQAVDPLTGRILDPDPLDGGDC